MELHPSLFMSVQVKLTYLCIVRAIAPHHFLGEISVFCFAVFEYVWLISSGGNNLTVPSASCIHRFKRGSYTLGFVLPLKSPDF